MTEVEITLKEEDIDCITQWFESCVKSEGINFEDIDPILHVLLMKTCIHHGIPFHVKVIGKGGD